MTALLTRLKMWKPRQPGQLQLVDRLPLTPQHTLFLVNCGGRQVLVGASPQGIQFHPVAPGQNEAT